MRIGIDARLNAYRQGGIAQYTRQLLTALAAEAPDDIFVALQHYSQRRPLVVAANVERAPLLTPPHNRFEQVSLPSNCCRDASTCSTAPTSSPRVAGPARR